MADDWLTDLLITLTITHLRNLVVFFPSRSLHVNLIDTNCIVLTSVISKSLQSTEDAAKSLAITGSEHQAITPLRSGIATKFRALTAWSNHSFSDVYTAYALYLSAEKSV